MCAHAIPPSYRLHTDLRVFLLHSQMLLSLDSSNSVGLPKASVVHHFQIVPGQADIRPRPLLRCCGQVMCFVFLISPHHAGSVWFIFVLLKKKRGQAVKGDSTCCQLLMCISLPLSSFCYYLLNCYRLFPHIAVAPRGPRLPHF